MAFTEILQKNPSKIFIQLTTRASHIVTYRRGKKQIVPKTMATRTSQYVDRIQLSTYSHVKNKVCISPCLVHISTESSNKLSTTAVEA